MLLLTLALWSCSPSPVVATDADADADGVDRPEDCDDTDACVHPGATEIWYDGVDQDCAGDDDFDQDADGFDVAADCDDTDATVYPGAADTPYDGVDQDCGRDGDEDADGDGFTVAEDCDDADARVHPGAADPWYDGIDQDCAGNDDMDQDGDGVPVGLDCDDVDATVHPGAADVWYDGVDQDCAGDDDLDQDGDGYDLTTDCDDSDPGVHPAAVEIWYDGVDQDCVAGDDDRDGDGVDHALDCDDDDAAVYPGAPEIWYDGVDADCAGDDDLDQDCDGYDVTTDCDDLDADIAPDAVEVCDNGVDDDCDGEVDEARTWYADADGDGYGGEDYTVESCSEVAGYFAESGDCDDADFTVHPGAAEACDDGIDADCDGADASGTGSPDVRSFWTEASATATGLGTDVFPAGDVDDDGYDDFLVASPGGAGIVYLFRGPVSATFTAADAWATWTGVGNDQAGTSAAHGDFDGDGAMDLLIGAPASSTGGRGQVYVLHGPIASGAASLATVATGTLTGEDLADYAGCSVANAGDVDGDGIDDVIVGASGNDDRASYSGSAYIVLDPPRASLGLAGADIVLRGRQAGGMFGTAVSGAGDPDGDGRADVLVGAPQESLTSASYDEGAAYLFAVLAAGEIDTASATARMYEETRYGYAGTSVAGAGDVNGDGVDDLLVGAPSTDYDTEDSRGDAYVIFGPVSGDLSLWDADVTIEGLSNYNYFGSAAWAAGDVNGDGLADILVSAWGDDEDSATTRAGAHFVFHGPLSCVVDAEDADFNLRGSVAGAMSSAAPAGDVDGDGVPDLLFSYASGTALVPGSSLLAP